MFTRLALSAAVALGSLGVSADDTEIYLNPSSPDAADPLVMMTLDWRPNLGSSTCGDYRDPSCEASVGSVIYPALVDNIEEFGLAYRDTTGDGNIDVFSVEPFDLVRAAIRTVVSNPLVSNLRLGLAISHNQNNRCEGPGQTDCSNGGYILKGLTPLSTDDFDSGGTVKPDSPRGQLLEKLGRIPAPSGNVSHPYQLRELYYEIFSYLTGGKVYNGHNGYTDYASRTDTLNLNDATNTYRATTSGPDILDTTPFQWDETIEDGSGNYQSPYTDGDDWSCSKTFIINTYFEDNQQADSDSAIQTTLASLSSGFRLSGGDSARNEAFIRLLDRTDIADGQGLVSYDSSTYSAPDVDGDQTVQSYFITAKQTTNNADDYAFAGGTDRALRLDDPGQLVTDLENIFQEVLSVSTTFVAASVPVNVFNRSEIVDNIYFALFQAESSPLWNGNLKKLKILEKTGTGGDTFLDIVSAEAGGTNSAIATDGRIRHSALTYWTNSNGYDVQATPEDEEVVGADGRSVTRGGAGQQIPGFLNSSNAAQTGFPGYTNDDGQRQLYTETITGHGDLASTPTSEPELLALDADTSGATALQNRLGAFSVDEAQDLLAWARGFDVDHPDYVRGSNDVIRSWFMGDPIHSRPVAVNYGIQPGFSQTEPDIKIYIGGNDGYIRAIQDSTNGSNASGEELYAFMPDDVLMNLDILRNNSPVNSHPYGVDGAPVVGTIDNDNDGNIEVADNDKALLFFGLRRGGRSIYSLDISNPSKTAAPTLNWKIKKPITLTGTDGTVSTNTNVFQTNLSLTPGALRGGRLIVTSGVHTNEPFYHIVDNDSSSITVRGDVDGDGNMTPEFETPETGIAFTVKVYGNDDFPELGLTFSPPQIGRVKFGTESIPVVFFAGGYDPDKDNMGNGDDDEGVGIYIVNALTGELVWKVTGGSGSNSDTHYIATDMVDSFPAPVRTHDANNNGIVDRLYVGDTGGSVWRIDVPEGEGSGWRRNNWFANKLADFGDDAAVDDRRFFHSVDVVKTRDNCVTGCGPYDGVVITSGNRASPRNVDTTNYLFVIKDRLTTSGDDNARTRTPLGVSDLTDITNLCISGEESSCQNADLLDGWRLTLEATGEKGLAAPLVSQGTIFFTTYLPQDLSADACAPSEGSGLIYAVNLNNGSVDIDVLGGDIDDLDKTNRYTSAGKGIPPGATKLGPKYVLLPGEGINDRQIITQTGETFWRIFWRELGFDNY